MASATNTPACAAAASTAELRARSGSEEETATTLPPSTPIAARKAAAMSPVPMRPRRRGTRGPSVGVAVE